MNMYYIYIMSNKRHGTLYVGMTKDLIRRVYEHKHNLAEGFTCEHSLHTLVYFETTEDPYEAIRREKRLKKWYRSWKIELIESDNPDWRDLYPEIVGIDPRSRRG